MSAATESPTAPEPASRRPRLAGHAAFAAVLAMAGLPLYVHAPKVYADAYGVSLGALGTVLFVLRLLDVVQDPLLGRLAGAVRAQRGLAVTVGGAGLAAGMVGLFAVTPPVAPLWWFAGTMTLVFTSFSFLTIIFYARGVTAAGQLGAAGHVRLARWRETGSLLGVATGAALPTVLAGAGLPAFPLFAVLFVMATLGALWLMRHDWPGGANLPDAGLRPILRDRVARRLLVAAFANAAPVAVTSTLFLFYVESRLAAPGWEGSLLLLFFLSAAAAAPLWGRAAERTGPKRTLMAAMGLSLASFAAVLALGVGDVAAFAVICVLTGVATGADLTLLPAIFAARMARVAPSATSGFALWSFVQKSTLAFAAIALLPSLSRAGFEPGAENAPEALRALSLMYAGLPCLLKLAALAVLAATPVEED
ncbi:MFS transporter [Roseivivax marinus]|uniref:MFS transporter n=1 Tax=Roseivivax marinus TaxID=1379903 RepID=UPI00273E83F6|nr:MFS transporter [Roseivivax marinus]